MKGEVFKPLKTTMAALAFLFLIKINKNYFLGSQDNGLVLCFTHIKINLKLSFIRAYGY